MSGLGAGARGALDGARCICAQWESVQRQKGSPSPTASVWERFENGHGAVRVGMGAETIWVALRWAQI